MSSSDPSDAWAELQALKMKRDNRRRRVEERKKERQDIMTASPSVPSAVWLESTTAIPIVSSDTENTGESSCEESLLRCLSDVTLILPTDSRQLQNTVIKDLRRPISHEQIVNLLQKFAVQQLISTQDKVSDGGLFLEIVSSEHTKLMAMVTSTSVPTIALRKRKANEELTNEDQSEESSAGYEDQKSNENDVLSLLSLASTKEKEHKRIGEEILELLSRPSAKEKTLAAQFRSQGGTNVQEFCPHGTKSECRRMTPLNRPCKRLHFRKIIQSHTDESLGDCSFLNTCFHMESCKYVHYEVDTEKGNNVSTSQLTSSKGTTQSTSLPDKPTSAEIINSVTVLHPPQWVHCDLRFFDMTVLGKFSVIMADPPWDIHMELPYGTLSDDEMRHLNIPALQDEGLIFLWVTGRAMELGRECLQLWGYERVDELIWVKTNQLQRIIRTGRTGHWLNHGKEHCLVGMKGNPAINRGLDADIIVAEVRATSHKPDEVYGIIERLSPGTRKIELFGRPHNIQPNWMTLGNQLAGVHLVEEDLQNRYFARYPDGDCMVKPK